MSVSAKPVEQEAQISEEAQPRRESLIRRLLRMGILGLPLVLIGAAALISLGFFFANIVIAGQIAIWLFVLGVLAAIVAAFALPSSV